MLKYASPCLVFTLGFVQMSLSDEVQRGIIVSTQKLECVLNSSEQYLADSGGDPILIFMDFCPSNRPSVEALSDLATAFDPNFPRGNSDDEQRFISLRRHQVECLAEGNAEDSITRFGDFVDLSALLGELCGP